MGSWNRFGAGLRLGLPLMLLGVTAQAQWATQVVNLQPGWNAVYLEVDPEPGATEAVFAGIDLGSVWTWNGAFTSVQYIQDPAAISPGQPEWLKFFAPESPNAVANDLHVINGGRAYLVNLAGSAPVQWQIVGTPLYREQEWRGDSFNLVGFRVAGDSTMTLSQYFAASPAHVNEKMLKLDSAGHWMEISDPATEVIERGQAYWIYTAGQSSYQGPFSATLEDTTTLAFGRSLPERDLILHNTRTAPVTATLSPQASGTPPGPEQDLLAGDVLLSWYNENYDQEILQWEPLDAGQTFTVPANGSLRIRIAPRRAEFAVFTPPDAQTPFLYQSILEVTDGAGSLLRLGVSAQGVENVSQPLAGARGANKATLEEMFGNRFAGLWYGTVSLNKVNQPRNATPGVGPDTPIRTNSEFVFPIVLHVDFEGNVSLLQHATVMWKDGTTRPDPTDPSLQVLDEPGRYVIVANDTLLDQFQGSTLRDGEQVGRRFASAAFSNREPVTLSGDFGTALDGEMTIADNDPLNPFKHLYHPDHNMAVSRPTVRADGSDSTWWTVTRQIAIEFTDEDPESNESTRWGDQVMGGIYREAMIGLHKNVIRVEGFLRLSKILNIGVLNDGIE